MSTIHSLSDLRVMCGRKPDSDPGAPPDRLDGDLAIVAAVAEGNGWDQDLLFQTMQALAVEDYRRVATIAGWDIAW